VRQRIEEGPREYPERIGERGGADRVLRCRGLTRAGTMPTYEYRCPKGHEFDLRQRMSDEPKASCPTCGAAAERLLSAGAGFLFKGEGFYITDYRSESYRAEAKADRGDGSGEGDVGGNKIDKGAAKGDKAAASDGKGGSSGASGTADSTSKPGKSSGSEAPKAQKKSD